MAPNDPNQNATAAPPATPPAAEPKSDGRRRYKVISRIKVQSQKPKDDGKGGVTMVGSEKYHEPGDKVMLTPEEAAKFPWAVEAID